MADIIERLRIESQREPNKPIWRDAIDEIEALRAEVERSERYAEQSERERLWAEERAERLAEALREAQPFIGWTGSYPELHAKIDALLREQEEGK